ncbi:MAG: Lrp/AsnC family transcriptional regulator [Lachnospiraceae bacterium]|nr:Lrp/AsnC family transcriptional regulator [Lachnospiraceae bacterium]
MTLKERILRLIDSNAKLTAPELAIMLGSSEDEVSTAIAEMEADNTICGYLTLINWEKIEQDYVTALIEVKVTPQRGQGFDTIAERIYKFDEVEAVYLMSGGFDLTVVIKGKSMRDVAGFVSAKLAPMEAILSTATHFVLKKYKEHGIAMESEETDERMLVSP